MATERIVQLKESGVECSIDQHTINIRIGPSKEKGAKPDYGNFAVAAYESLDNIDDIIKSLEEEMAQTAKELEFERAGELRDQIKELNWNCCKVSKSVDNLSN